MKTQEITTIRIKNKDKVNLRQKEWYLKNREEKLSKSKEYVKNTNYKYEKTESQRLIRNIKRKTRYIFPLSGELCGCGNKAEVRHHNTVPIKFDKFDFMCTKCHNIEHGNINNNYKEVENNGN